MLLSSSCSTDVIPTNNSQLSHTGIIRYESGMSQEKKVEFAKNRRKEIWLIRKGDYFMIKNNPLDAIVAYSEALEKLPGDFVIQKKLAHAYFANKDWVNAYEMFVKVPTWELKNEDKRNMFRALFFEESELDRIWELQKFSLGTGELEYYRIVDTCYGWIEVCIGAISAFTGTSRDMESLQNILKNATKISPDLAYRNFSLATQFYVLGEFRAAYELSKNILRERGDYFDVQKLLWFSLFSLGRYTEARTILKTYIEQVPTDITTIIRLGEIAGILKEFTEANLYLNNAVIAWYTPKADIERQLAYNYSALWDTVAMVKVLSYLLSEKESIEDDFAVAISLAFSRWENARAYVWAIEWLKKFPDSSVLASLYMTALRLIGRAEDAEKYYTTLSGALLDSPLIILERGINAFDSGNLTGALEHLEKVIAIDPDADFGIEAANYIDQINQQRPVEDPLSVPLDTDETAPAHEKKWWF